MAQGLDRRIRIALTEQTRDEHGRTQTTVTAVLDVWATKVQDKVAREFANRGSYVDASQTWRVRYDQRIVDTFDAGHGIVLEGEVVTQVGEPVDTRRRWLDLLI